MFAHRFFPDRMFPGRYFPPMGPQPWPKGGRRVGPETPHVRARVQENGGAQGRIKQDGQSKARVKH